MGQRLPNLDYGGVILKAPDWHMAKYDLIKTLLLVEIQPMSHCLHKQLLVKMTHIHSS